MNRNQTLMFGIKQISRSLIKEEGERELGRIPATDTLLGNQTKAGTRCPTEGARWLSCDNSCKDGCKESSKDNQGGGLGRRRGILPDDVVLVPQVKFLPVVPGTIDHSNPRHKINDLFGGRVVKVVAALVTSVAINPLQPQVALRGASVSHASPFPTGERILPPGAPRNGGRAEEFSRLSAPGPGSSSCA